MLKEKAISFPMEADAALQRKAVHIHTTGIRESKDVQHIPVALFEVSCTCVLQSSPYDVFSVPILAIFCNEVRMCFGNIVQAVGHAFTDIRGRVGFKLF